MILYGQIPLYEGEVRENGLRFPVDVILNSYGKIDIRDENGEKVGIAELLKDDKNTDNLIIKLELLDDSAIINKITSSKNISIGKTKHKQYRLAKGTVNLHPSVQKPPLKRPGTTYTLK